MNNLVALINSSKVSTNYDDSYGKPHVYRFWTMHDCVKFVSDKPFSRYDFAYVESTPDSRVLLLDPVSRDDLTPEQIQSTPFLVPVATDVPLSDTSDYDFQVIKGNATILREVPVTDDNLLAYILLLAIYDSPVVLRGTDRIHPSVVEFVLNFSCEFKAIRSGEVVS